MCRASILLIVRILLADDHEAIRLGMRTLLESQRGWEVCGEADNGETAIHKTRELKPDVVILDILMPGLNGFAAAKVIKELSPNTAILVYSAYHSEAFLHEARRMDLDGFVSKSESRRVILDAVETVRRSRLPLPN